MGSPLLFVSQGPPKPLHSVFPAVGPAVRFPVALSNTAKSRFTHCTNCVDPAAPLVSGGAQQFEKVPVIPTPTPKKSKPGIALTRGPMELCSTGSGCDANSLDPCVMCSGLTCFGSMGLGNCGRSRKAGETSCLASLLTSGWLCAHIGSGLQSTQNHSKGNIFHIAHPSKFEF